MKSSSDAKKISRPNTANAPSRRRQLALLAFLSGIAVCLYRLLFVYPLVPYEMGVDSPLLLAASLRMWWGQSLYLDFVHHIAPGSCDLYYALFRLFGPKAWIPSAALWCLGVGFAAVGIWAAGYFVRGWMKYVPALLFIAIPFRTRLDATHHWFSSLFVLGAATVLLKERKQLRLVAAGVLCAVASWFTQSRGEITIGSLVLFLLWEYANGHHDRRKFLKAVALLLASFCAAFGLLMGHHFWTAGVSNVINQTYVFVARYARFYRPHDNFDKYWYWDDLMNYTGFRSKRLLVIGLRVFMYLLIPAIYLLAGVRLIFVERKWRNSGSAPIVLFTLVGSFSFLLIARSPGLYRLSYDSMFAFILLSWYLAANKPGRLAIRGFAVGMAVLLAYFCHSSKVTILNLPAGQIAYRADPEYLDIERWLSSNTRPGDYVYQPFWGSFYFSYQLQNPTPIPSVSNTRAVPPEDLSQVVRCLGKNPVHYIIWGEQLNSSYDDLGADYLIPLRAFMRDYRLVHTFGDGRQLWRNDSVASSPRE